MPQQGKDTGEKVCWEKVLAKGVLGKGPGKRCAGDEVVTQDFPKFSWKHKPLVRVRRKYTQKVPRPWGEKEYRIQQYRRKEG